MMIQSFSQRTFGPRRCPDIFSVNEIHSYCLLKSRLSRRWGCMRNPGNPDGMPSLMAEVSPVVARYYAELVNFFARSLNDREAATDVVQESYARVFALQAREVAVRDLRALLFRTGKNIVIDDARRRTVEAHVLETLALVSAHEAPSTERAVASRQQLELLVRRLTAMPRKRRDVFVLVRIYGFTHAEAAQHMGISEQAVEKHVVRAVCDCMGLMAA